MNELSNYLIKHSEIKEIAFFIENTEEMDWYDELFDATALNNIYIYSTDNVILDRIKSCYYKKRMTSERHIPECICTINDGKILDIKHNIDCVYYDSAVDVGYVMKMAGVSPKHLIVRTREAVQVCFNIWETYRKISEYIYIQHVNNCKTEVLDWNKNEYEKELSVVFPVYNVAGYLDKCFDTVLAWKADYVEYIFVNDGSPDNSRDKILEFQKKDSRVVLVDKENGGCATARKKGQLEAKGRYVTFFDPDDFITGNMHRELLQRAMLGNYDISYCGFNYYYENSNTFESVPDALGEPYISGTTNVDEIHRLMMYARVAIWRGIYRKEFLDRANISFYEDLRRFDDLPFKVETFATAKSVVAVPMYMYNYRLQRPGQDVACTDERLYVHFDIFKHLDEFILRSKNQKLIDYLQMVKVQTHIYGMQKIDKKYLRKYASMARKDLKTNGSMIRTMLLLNRCLGKRKMLQYVFLKLHMNGMAKKIKG